MKLFGSFVLLALLTSAYVVDANGCLSLTPSNVFPVSGPQSTMGAAIRDDVGIKEVVPRAFQQKYRKWKGELLSTEFGRQQWEQYANSKNFLLKIVVSRDRRYGAGTDDFEWTEDGQLVGATITLGKNLDEGYPDPVYYPIMNSLATYDGLYQVSGSILASAKMIHEIGHVSNTAETNSKLFQKQNRLISSYNSIFLKNGYNVADPRLVALANELGAKPIEIWEAREYQSEVAALRYLVERIGGEPFGCSVFARMRRNVSNYVRNYKDRFQNIVIESGAAGMPGCGLT